MDTDIPLQNAHPKGESKTTRYSPRASWPLDTPGGRFHAEWDDQAPVTREGQLICFFQFLQAGERWQEFLREYPLHYVGNRGNGADNVMGTILLSVLSGHWRYAPINTTDEAKKTRRRKDRQSGRLANSTGAGWNPQASPWSGKIAVLDTSLPSAVAPTTTLPKHYRDRSDAENSFDELKNQWGWCGYTTRQLAASKLMANWIALIYNWWSLYLRFFDEQHHREAIRTRPMLMSGMGRQVQSGGQSRVKVSIVHDKSERITQPMTRISKEIHVICGITELWNATEKWTLLLTRILRHWLGGKWLPGLPAEAKILLSG